MTSHSNSKPLGVLYLIPVPLIDEGGMHTLPDYVVKRVHLLKYFVVERAKSARHFVKSCVHPTPIAELFFEELSEHTSANDLPKLLKPLMAGYDVGLLSEAGCPAVADPGSELVKLAHKKGIEVRPLVGPNSILLSLMASGMNGQHFTFHGYLPAKKPDLVASLKKIELSILKQKDTHIFIEAPYRNNSMVESILQNVHPEVRLCIARDLSDPSLEWVKTFYIREWKQMTLPELHKHPTIFLLGE